MTREEFPEDALRRAGVPRDQQEELRRTWGAAPASWRAAFLSGVNDDGSGTITFATPSGHVPTPAAEPAPEPATADAEPVEVPSTVDAPPDDAADEGEGGVDPLATAKTAREWAAEHPDTIPDLLDQERAGKQRKSVITVLERAQRDAAGE